MPAVLFVSYSGLWGGAERVLLDCASALSEPVVLLCPEGELARRSRAAGVPVLTLPAAGLTMRGSLRSRVRAVCALAGHALALRRAAHGVEPDLIVTWGMRSALAARVGVPARPAVIAHNDFLPGPVIGAAVRRVAARAEAVIVPSAAVAGDLDPHGRLSGHLHVVHPGIDVESFDPMATPADPPEVVVLGALADWKRPELALEVCALARRRVPHLQLRLVGAPLTGDPCLPERLRRRAQAPDLAGAVELVGSRDDPRADLRRATCLLHCAPREPFGLVVLEALASGRPVVVPNTAGPQEIVAFDAACARVYPPEDVAAAAAAVTELVSDPEGARRAGRAGRELVRRHFGRSRTQAAFAEVLRPELERVRRGDGTPVAEPGVLTLVTVTHNSAVDLPMLLDSVARYLPGAHTVVVDSASTDASVTVAGERAAVEVVALPENVGFGAACNRGVARVQTPVVALVNPDVELIDASLLELVAEALRADAPERLLAPRVLNRDGSLQDTAHPLPGSRADLIRALVPPGGVPGPAGVALAPWRARQPRRVGWAVGCALVARTETLRALGPFHESLFMFGEDLELALHARDRGIDTCLWPRARVVHRGAHSTEREYGGEAFERLARGRHDAVRLRRGSARAGLDDATQALTFASRIALKRILGRPAGRERRQLAAVAGLRRPRWE